MVSGRLSDSRYMQASVFERTQHLKGTFYIKGLTDLQHSEQEWRNVWNIGLGRHEPRYV